MFILYGDYLLSAMFDQNRITNRRTFLKTGSVALAAALAGCSGDGGDGGDGSNGGDGSGGGPQTTEQSDFPEQPVTFIIPYSTGGGYNYYTRLVCKYINQEDYLPVEAQPQNVTGGGGIVGHNRLFNADPDGYTAGIINPDSLAPPQVLGQDEVEYDLAEYTFYPRIAGTTRAIAVGADTDVTNTEELITGFQNEELVVGNTGLNSLLTCIALGIGTDTFPPENILNNAVQFDGQGEETTAIKRGDVHVSAGSYSSLLPFVESGDLRMITVFTKEDEPPSPDKTPDAETFADIDIEDPDTAIGIAGGAYHRVFAGPPDIPDERASVIREAIKKAIQNPDLQEEAQNNDRPISFAPSDETANGVQSTVEGWQERQDLLEQVQEYSG